MKKKCLNIFIGRDEIGMTVSLTSWVGPPVMGRRMIQIFEGAHVQGLDGKIYTIKIEEVKDEQETGSGDTAEFGAA